MVRAKVMEVTLVSRKLMSSVYDFELETISFGRFLNDLFWGWGFVSTSYVCLVWDLLFVVGCYCYCYCY